MTGLWDIHNHILPGVDDGSSCMEETEEMLRAEYAQGVRHLILTPHYRKGMFEIEEEPRRRVFAQLMERYETRLASELPGMTFALGCELHLHPSQVERAAKPVYRMPGSGIVLAEFSGRDDYGAIARKLREMNGAGFACIIAHAERYKLNAEDIRRLKKHPGTYIQVNAGSILGKEGLHQRLLTHKLLEENLVDFVGSDAHNVSERKVNIGPCAEWITKKYGPARTRTLLMKNQEALFGPRESDPLLDE